MAIENWPETGRIPVYLVGGAVRDRLLGRTPREYDFAFDADEATFLQRNPEARKVGKSVSVFLLRGQEFMPLEGTLEEDLLPPRSDHQRVGRGSGRQPSRASPCAFGSAGRHPAARFADEFPG